MDNVNKNDCATLEEKTSIYTHNSDSIDEHQSLNCNNKIYLVVKSHNGKFNYKIIIGDITNQQLRLDQKPKDDRTLAWPYVPINGEANDLEKEIRKQGFEGPINIRRE